MPSIPLTGSQRRILKKFGVNVEWDADILQRFLKYTTTKVVSIDTLWERATNAQATSMVRRSGIWKDVD